MLKLIIKKSKNNQISLALFSLEIKKNFIISSSASFVLFWKRFQRQTLQEILRRDKW